MDVEKVVDEIFSLIRGMTEKMSQIDKNFTSNIGEINNKLTEVCTTLKEKEKQCSNHQATSQDHEKRIRQLENAAAAAAEVIKTAPARDGRIYDLEKWRASQEGVSGFLWKFGPIIISVCALIYAINKGGGHP